MTLKQLLRTKPYLNWSTKDTDNLSDEAVVSSILNYGDFSDVSVLLGEFGVAKVKKIFDGQLKQRNNYNKKTINFFTKYLTAHA